MEAQQVYAQPLYAQPLAIGDANVWLRTEEGEWSRVAATNVTVQPEGVVTLTADGTRMWVPLWAVLTIESAPEED